VTIVETVLVFALIPLAIYGVIMLLTLWPKATRTPRYRPGQEWGFEPVWWSASPAGVSGAGHAQDQTETAAPAGAVRGGARGKW
jgi:hypothetical protein